MEKLKRFGTYIYELLFGVERILHTEQIVSDINEIYDNGDLLRTAMDTDNTIPLISYCCNLKQPLPEVDVYRSIFRSNIYEQLYTGISVLRRVHIDMLVEGLTKEIKDLSIEAEDSKVCYLPKCSICSKLTQPEFVEDGIEARGTFNK